MAEKKTKKSIGYTLEDLTERAWKSFRRKCDEQYGESFGKTEDTKSYFLHLWDQYFIGFTMGYFEVSIIPGIENGTISPDSAAEKLGITLSEFEETLEKVRNEVKKAK